MTTLKGPVFYNFSPNGKNIGIQNLHRTVLQGNPYFENAPLLPGEVAVKHQPSLAVMVGDFQSTAYGAVEGEMGGFVKSQPCWNPLGPGCFDGKFYRRPPIKFYIISTAMLHGAVAHIRLYWRMVDTR